MMTMRFLTFALALALTAGSLSVPVAAFGVARTAALVDVAA